MPPQLLDRFGIRGLVAGLCLAAASCGSVGEPLPPLLNIPARVDDLVVRQDVGELVAEWTWPVLGSEGQVFRETERFELRALHFDPSGETPSPQALDEHGSITATFVAGSDETEPGSRIVIRAPLGPYYGRRVGLGVRVVSTRGKASAWSALSVLDVVRPPAAPERLEAETIETGVALNWGLVGDASGYIVERRLPESEFVEIARPTETRFLDVAASWDVPAAYRILSFRSAGESPDVAGVASDAVAITPRDVFAPAMPTDLRAISSDEGVEISWRSNSEPDLAGYRVSRDGVALHEGMLEAANVSAPPIPAGESVAYEVVAIDRAGNASPADAVSAAAPQ